MSFRLCGIVYRALDRWLLSRCWAAIGWPRSTIFRESQRCKFVATRPAWQTTRFSPGWNVSTYGNQSSDIFPQYYITTRLIFASQCMIVPCVLSSCRNTWTLSQLTASAVTGTLKMVLSFCYFLIKILGTWDPAEAAQAWAEESLIASPAFSVEVARPRKSYLQ